ncbi:MAG: hypothetical protein IIA45_02490 [Bacteroidetes bacterium]|nr:hypothetical protein [Bacteroidota bacterium]
MEITKENIDDLNAVINVSLKEADYGESVDKKLKEYRRDVKMDGFRKGNVPLGMVKKMYGQEVLLAEVNTLIQENLQKYIKDEKLKLIVDPLLNQDLLEPINFDNPGEIKFSYEIGLSPQFEINYSGKKSFEKSMIRLDKELLDKHISSFREKYGKLNHADKVTENGYFEVTFKELSAENIIVVGGITNTATFPLSAVKNEATLKLMLPLQEGNTLDINLMKTFERDLPTVASEFLKITAEVLENTNPIFRMTLDHKYELELAEVDQKLFDTVLGPGVAKDEKDFYDKYKEKIKCYYDGLTQRRLFRAILNEIINNTKITLPDTFLKKWLGKNSQQQLTAEQIEDNYSGYVKGLKERLIKEAIMDKNDIKLEDDEINAKVEKYIDDTFAQNYPGHIIPEDEIKKYKEHLVNDGNFLNDMIESVVEEKILSLLKSRIKITEKEVSLDEFVEAGKPKN